MTVNSIRLPFPAGLRARLFRLVALLPAIDWPAQEWSCRARRYLLPSAGGQRRQSHNRVLLLL